MAAPDREETIGQFRAAVNMTAAQIEKWLETDESREVGQKSSEGAESTGHQSGRHIIALLHKPRADYTDDDLHQMQRVVSYVHRHLAQRPAGDVGHTHWRYSLMNWGHDPMKRTGREGA